ncbi:MAG: ABC-2 transporter permease, partial [Oscillospiraceae bacterium]
MNLINIIKKDFVAYKKTWMFSLLYLLVFPLIIKNTNMNIMLITFVVYMVLGNAMAYDEKYKFDVFLGILPIKRKTVILSKMIELNLTYFVGSAILLIVGL